MSNIIDKIQVSGVTYDIQGSGGGGGNPTVELTQAEYDALVTAGTVSADTYYIITDAQAGDLTNYYTKTEVDNAITAATSTKQDTLVSGTNIKTINNESLLGSGNIDIQGGGASYSAGTGIDITNDVISVSGVSHNSLADGTKMLLRGDVTINGQNYSNIRFDYYYGTSSNKNNITIKPLTINGESALQTQASSISVIETSAITTAITSSSTDAQVPSAKAVYDAIQEGGGGGGSTYTAGDGIDITNNVISVTGKADTSAVTEVSDALTAHTANTNVHLTTTEKTNLDSLATNISAISGITASKKSNWDTAYSRSVANAVSYSINASEYTFINMIWVGTQSQYDQLGSWAINNNTLYIIKDNN